MVVLVGCYEIWIRLLAHQYTRLSAEDEFRTPMLGHSVCLILMLQVAKVTACVWSAYDRRCQDLAAFRLEADILSMAESFIYL